MVPLQTKRRPSYERRLTVRNRICRVRAVRRHYGCHRHSCRDLANRVGLHMLIFVFLIGFAAGVIALGALCHALGKNADPKVVEIVLKDWAAPDLKPALLNHHIDATTRTTGRAL